MNVDIYIREKTGSREIRIPWLPESITCQMGSAITAQYDIMNRGEVAVPTGTELTTVSWKSVFPGKNRTDTSIMRGDWNDPKTYFSTIEDWKQNGTVLNIIVTGYPINMDVFISDFSCAPSGAFGDMEYEITLKENRDIVITKTATATTDTSKQQARATTTAKTYTIKSGDTLWKIAQQQLGAGSKWQSIYNANKEIIESTAKKYGKSSSNNGWWIYPGVTLTIPS